MHDHVDVGVDLRDRLAGRDRLGLAHVALPVDDLSLQVGLVDLVELDDAEGADTGSGQVEQRRAAEPACPDHQDAGVLQPLLAVHPDVGDDQVAAVATYLVDRQFGSRLDQRGQGHGRLLVRVIACTRVQRRVAAPCSPTAAQLAGRASTIRTQPFPRMRRTGDPLSAGQPALLSLLMRHRRLTVGAVAGEKVTVEVDGQTLQLSNLDKVLYPETGFTKGEVIDYYRQVADVLLPHLADRLLTRKRWPDGTGKDPFFEKNAPRGTPSWVRTVEMPEHGDDGVDYVVCDDLPTLVWLANLAALELHVPQWRIPDDDAPPQADLLVFDLDPGPPADIIDCCNVALAVRQLLEADGLTAFAKTSGNKGAQLYVPVEPTGPEQTSAYAKRMAQQLEEALPDLVVSLDGEEASHAARCSSTGARTTAPRRPSRPTRCAGGPSPLFRRRSHGTRCPMPQRRRTSSSPRRTSSTGSPSTATSSPDLADAARPLP